MEAANDFGVPADELKYAELRARVGARIQADNQAFAKASAANKRVSIAQDVLALLKVGGLKAKTGAYVLTDADDAKEVAYGEKCTACALGALFIASAAKDACSYTHDFGFGEGEKPVTAVGVMRSRLAPYFGHDELLNIENAFEGRKNDGKSINSLLNFIDENNYSERAIKYNAGIRSPRKRMERIMRNIIRHSGRFVA